MKVYTAIELKQQFGLFRATIYRLYNEGRINGYKFFGKLHFDVWEVRQAVRPSPIVDQPTEEGEWKNIDGWDNYMVISTGLVKQKVRTGRRKAGAVKPQRSANGYYQVQLIDGSKRKFYYVHRLVAMAFIPNPSGLVEINHKDLVKSNNRVENLEWCTRKENIAHYKKSKSNERNLQQSRTHGIADGRTNRALLRPVNADRLHLG